MEGLSAAEGIDLIGPSYNRGTSVESQRALVSATAVNTVSKSLTRF